MCLLLGKSDPAWFSNFSSKIHKLASPYFMYGFTGFDSARICSAIREQKIIKVAPVWEENIKMKPVRSLEKFKNHCPTLSIPYISYPNMIWLP